MRLTELEHFGKFKLFFGWGVWVFFIFIFFILIVVVVVTVICGELIEDDKQGDEDFAVRIW